LIVVAISTLLLVILSGAKGLDACPLALAVTSSAGLGSAAGGTSPPVARPRTAAWFVTKHQPLTMNDQQ
jgi:hypothetical protein